MKKTRGFTFVEIMSTIAVMGILITIILSGTTYYRNRSQDESRKADLKKLGASIVLSRSDNTSDLYPISTDAGGYTNVWECLSQGSPTGFELAKTMSTIPIDNYSASKCYFYKSILGGQAFELSFKEKSTGDNYIIYGIADCTKWSDITAFGGVEPVGEEIATGTEDCQIAGEVTPPITPVIPSVNNHQTPTGSHLVAKIDGSVAGSVLGFAFTRIGDQDGDNKEDIVVIDGGSAFIYGSKLKFTTKIVEIGSESAPNGFGSVVLVGDQDGDGKEDLLLGASGFDTNRGKVNLYGSKTNWGLMNTINGPAQFSWFSTAMSSISDQDGDGIRDFLITAPYLIGDHSVGEGRAYIYNYKGEKLHEFSDGQPYVNEISSPSTAKVVGDQDGDGKDDVLFMRFSKTINGKAYAGESYLFGSKTNWTLLKKFTGVVANDQLGGDAVSINDTDGDGKADILISGIQEAIYSNGLGVGLVKLFGNAWNIIKTWTVTSKIPKTVQLAVVSDQDGDGISDILMGSATTKMSDGQAYDGVVLLYGSKNNFNLLQVIKSAVSKGSFGTEIGWIGDQNGDGYAELLIGAPYNDENSKINSGSIYIYSLH